MPTGYDALDLTRCVIHAMQHPKKYFFPRDLEGLTEELGGPVQVCHGHLDAAVCARYAHMSTIFQRRLQDNLITEADHTPVKRDLSEWDSQVARSSRSLSDVSEHGKEEDIFNSKLFSIH